MIHYALFMAHPATEPPFDISLGIDSEVFVLKDCDHIPDGIARLEKHIKENNLELSPNFVLLYPIYMDAMNTTNESTMHSIAWMIKDEADAKGWNFDRIGGLTGRTERDFVYNR